MAQSDDPKRVRGMGRAAFIAVLPTVEAELKEGLPLKVVFERHQAKLGIGYKQFARYVQRLRQEGGIKTPLTVAPRSAPSEPSEAPASARPAPSAGTTRQPSPIAPEKPAASKTPPFVPVSIPKKD